MKNITIGIFLASSATALSAQEVLVPIPGANGYTNPATGQFYPNVAPNVVLDPRTGQTAVVPGAAPQAPAAPIQRIVDPNTGEVYLDVGSGYVNARTGRFVRK